MKTGDKVWFLPYGDGQHFIVRVTLEKREGDFFWIDEPVSHAVSIDHLFEEYDDAVKALYSRIADWNNVDDHEMQFRNELDIQVCHDLNEWRVQTLKFTKSTYKLNGLHFDVEGQLKTYPDKYQTADWYNSIDIGL